ncbi:Bifunctional (P)ppGpp synthetase/guanosine-3',5'-bis(Diphosphate) 3'-pyrophosphohydrolase OS=Streptomyces alboniger OX=132473 GN=CP975_26705 PE=3 SV=1 [Streptomyces alboniger]
MVSEFKDFIAVPKFNLYQSLHTAVARPRDAADSSGSAPGAGQVVEVLIRTHQMHKVAEAGVIALGNPYAPPPEEQTVAGDGERVDPTRPGWLSRLLDWQEAASDPDTFWSTLREDLAQDREITVFRPDGGTLGLPDGATCVDAAYAQYGEDAHACIGARVNGRLATLSTVLRDGDTVQLLMGQDPASEPSREWLEHAHTPAARIAIQRWIATHPVPAPAPGDEHTPTLQASEAAFRPAADTLDPRNASRNAPRTTAERLAAQADEPATTGSPAADAVVDQAGASVRLAGCCTPVPPDEVTAFAVRGGAVTVHRVECAAVERMKLAGRAEVGVRWGDTTECRVTLFAESFGRPHLLADLTEAMASEGAEIVSATVEPPSRQRVRHTYTVQLPDAAHLPALMRAMRNVPGVYDVSRAQPQALED